MPNNLIMQLNTLIGRWDTAAIDSHLSQITQGCSPEQIAYFEGIALAMETARDELSEVLAKLLQDVVKASGRPEAPIK